MVGLPEFKLCDVWFDFENATDWLTNEWFIFKDLNGHGTHCAGVAAGSTYGVAFRASIHGVKVLSDSGSGTSADVLEGRHRAYIRIRSLHVTPNYYKSFSEDRTRLI